MISSFDSNNLKQLRTEIDAALKTVQQKYGVRLSIGTISYDGVKATSRLTMIAVGDPTTAADPKATMLAKAQSDFNKYASSFGLKPEQYGATFKYGRDTYKLAGLKPGSPKYSILATNVSNGTTYKLPESSIASLQSNEHKELFGIKTTPTAAGMCSNDNAFDDKWNNIGKCNRTATTSRKTGFGRNGRVEPFCEQCAQLIDESRREMEAEARANR
jgi:hypothetical protein